VGLPIISFDRYLSDKIPIVSSDNYYGGKLAAQSLLMSGSRKLQIITGANRPNSPTSDRLKGFKEVLDKHDLNFDVMEIEFGSSPNIKSLKIKELLSKKQVDGIFCTDDLTALLVMQQARELGIILADDVRLVGYDGSKFIQNYHPELTTIMQPISDIVTMMIDLLLKRIDNPECQLEANYTLPVKLLTGETTI